MENNIYYKDSDRVERFGDEAGMEDIEAALPTLNKSNIRYIATYYSRLKRAPTYGELRLYGAILERRRGSAEGMLISSLNCDSVALMETYGDMLEKASALVGKRVSSLTLEESASVLPEYMRMIGRYDSRAFASGGKTSALGEGVSIIGDGAPRLTLGGRDKPLKKKRKKEGELAIVLADCDESTVAFLSDRRVRAKCRRILRIGSYGLLGLLSDNCEGAVIRESALFEGVSLTCLLTQSYIGKYAALIEPAMLRSFLRSAHTQGASVRVLGGTDTRGYIFGLGKDGALQIPLELVRGLANSQREVVASVSRGNAPRLRAPLPVFARCGDGEALDITNTLLKRQERLVAAFNISPDANSFSAAVNAMTDGVLRLAAAGVDRRGINLAAAYGLAKGVDAETFGETLAMISGIYRVGVELALSDGYTEARYTDGEGACCALYAEAPRKDISAVFTGQDTYVGFLPVCETDGGIVDFSSLRHTCDEFMSLCKRGLVLSAKAVTDEPSVAIREMERGGAEAELTDNGKIIANTPCKGILYESALKDITGMIGKISVNKP